VDRLGTGRRPEVTRRYERARVAGAGPAQKAVIELGTTLSKSGRTLARELNGELVLIDVDTGQYYTLNEVGGRVWALCDGSTTVAQLVVALCEEFDAPPEVVKADVVELVADLAKEGLLVESR